MQPPAEEFAGGRAVLVSRTCNQFHPRSIHTLSLEVLHGCIKRLAQGVNRRRICTNGCLGRTQEIPPADHASMEALAAGGGVLVCRTCNQFHPPSLPSFSLAVLHGCMKRLAQGPSPEDGSAPMDAWAVPWRYPTVPMHQRRRLLPVVACYQAAHATNSIHHPYPLIGGVAWLHEAPCSGFHA